MEKDKLKNFCLEAGADLFGVADINALKGDFALSSGALDKLNRAVCLGVGLSEAVLEEIEASPTRLYFHHYRTVNALLDQLAFKVSRYIQKKGFLSLPVPASQIIDWQNQKAHLSHKQIASMAGLGWIGRNNLLVNKELGSRLRLISILTDMPLETDTPQENNCGGCRSCIEVCPAQAIKEGAGDFNHIACFEKLKEFQKQRLVDQYICGVCVKACGRK